MNSTDRFKSLVAVWFGFTVIVIVALLNDGHITSEELVLTALLAFIVLGATAALADQNFVTWLQSYANPGLRANGKAKHTASGDHASSRH